MASFFFSRLFRPFTSNPPSASTRAITTMSSNAQKATVAAGCFWGVEHLYRKHFGDGKGLLDAKCGYTGGSTEDPNYKLVCSGTTGRTEPLPLSQPTKPILQ